MADRKIKKQRTLKQILMAGLGRSWMAWGPRNEVKRRCKVQGKSGWFRCESCGGEREKIEIDHISPVVPVTDGFTGWDNYISSKFVQADQLRGLCRDCHKLKTQKENKKRREAKKMSHLFCQHDDSSWCTDECPKRRKK